MLTASTIRGALAKYRCAALAVLLAVTAPSAVLELDATPAHAQTTTTSMSITIPPPSPQCADADESMVTTAVDSLIILRVAVQLDQCIADCVCDVDSTGTATSTDSLRALQYAVGQDVQMSCLPPCTLAMR